MMQTVSQIFSIMEQSQLPNHYMDVDKHGDVVLREGRYDPKRTGMDALIAKKLQEAGDRENLDVGQRKATYRTKAKDQQAKAVKSFTLAKLGRDKPVRKAPPPPRREAPPYKAPPPYVGKVKYSMGDHGNLRPLQKASTNPFDYVAKSTNPFDPGYVAKGTNPFDPDGTLDQRGTLV